MMFEPLAQMMSAKPNDAALWAMMRFPVENIEVGFPSGKPILLFRIKKSTRGVLFLVANAFIVLLF